MRYQTLVLAAAPTMHLFENAGFQRSRGMQRIDGLPLAIRAIESSIDDSSALTVLLNINEDFDFLKNAVREHFPESRVIGVNSKVKGALASAVLGAADLQPDLPLLIAPGDSTLHPKFKSTVESIDLSESAVHTLAFRSQNPRWSFLSMNENEEIVEVAEKQIIGKLATTGHFLFAETSVFLEAAEWVFMNNAHVGGQFYVSTALNYLISIGKNVTCTEILREGYKSYSKPYDFVEQST